MYHSILVPLDGSTFSEHSLPLALSIANRARAALTLIHIHSPLHTVYLEGSAFLDDSLDEDIKTQQRAYLDGMVKRIKSVQPDLKIQWQLLVGDVGTEVAAEATRTGADLVVMTTHGRGPLGKFWLGSNTDSLVRHLPMPLLLVHPDKHPVDLNAAPTLKHFLIPLDGTAHAEKIIPATIALGRLFDADYLLARIIKPVLPYDSPAELMTMTAAVQSVLDRVEELQRQLKDEAEVYLNKIAERLRSDGLTVATRVDMEMQPAAAILHDADEKGIDLVAVETHGRSGLSRLFHGSVADKVIRRSKMPVLIHKAS